MRLLQVEMRQPYLCHAFGTTMPRLWHDDATPLAQLCHALVTTVSKPLSQLCHTLVTTVTLLWHNCAHYLAQAE